MDLALPRFAMAEGPHQVHPPWPVTSESPASPAPFQIETCGREDSRCSMDQTSLSSVYLKLDALSSSSEEETLDVKKCENCAIMFVCNSEEAATHVNSDQVISDEEFPVMFGARDIRQVVRQHDKPPGGPTRRTARLDSRQEPSAPAVDLVTGKCRPEKVSRTVSTSPLTLDLTALCTPETDILQPGAAAQGVLLPGTATNSVTGFDTSVTN